MHRQVRTFNSPNTHWSEARNEMITEPKRKSHQGDNDREEHERRHLENMLDDALENTFPASDPVSMVLPTPPAADRDR